MLIQINLARISVDRALQLKMMISIFNWRVVVAYKNYPTPGNQPYYTVPGPRLRRSFSVNVCNISAFLKLDAG